MTDILKFEKGVFIDKDPLNETELKILILIASKVKKEDDLEKATYVFNIQQVKNFLGLPYSDNFKDLEDITEKMIGKIFEIDTEDGRKIFTKWLTSAKYDPKKQTVSFSILPELREFYSQVGFKIKLTNFDFFKEKYGKIPLSA